VGRISNRSLKNRDGIPTHTVNIDRSKSNKEKNHWGRREMWGARPPGKFAGFLECPKENPHNTTGKNGQGDSKHGWLGSPGVARYPNSRKIKKDGERGEKKHTPEITRKLWDPRKIPKGDSWGRIPSENC